MKKFLINKKTSSDLNEVVGNYINMLKISRLNIRKGATSQLEESIYNISNKYINLSSQHSRTRKSKTSRISRRVSRRPLTKNQISTHIADSTGITKKTANVILDELASLAYRETKRKGQITLPGIGKLVLQKRYARMGRNPATGETTKIPVKKVLKFRVAKACKDSIIGEG